MQDVEYGEMRPEEEMTPGMFKDPEGNVDDVLHNLLIGNHNPEGGPKSRRWARR